MLYKPLAYLGFPPLCIPLSLDDLSTAVGYHLQLLITYIYSILTTFSALQIPYPNLLTYLLYLPNLPHYFPY